MVLISGNLLEVFSSVNLSLPQRLEMICKCSRKYFVGSASRAKTGRKARFCNADHYFPGS